MLALGECGSTTREVTGVWPSSQLPLRGWRSSFPACLDRRRSLDFIFVYEGELVILLSGFPEL